MSCVDTDLCLKVDDLITATNAVNSSIQTQTENIISVDNSIVVVQQGEQLILGFLACFLFYGIFKFFYNFFRSLF